MRQSRLTELLERCLAASSSGSTGELDAILESAGDLRSELDGCLELIDDLDLAAELLAPAPTAEPLPESIGRFPVLGLLGEGGFSRVFAAFDPDLDRTVAIKLLRRTSGDAPHDRPWIEREARALAKLDDPHVVRVHELGKVADQPFLVTEHVPGPSLARVIQELQRAAAPEVDAAADAAASDEGKAGALANGLVSVEARIRMVARLARSLERCHVGGFIHRDIKPANVLLPSVERPVLIDFGLSHSPTWQRGSSVTNGLVGTALYLAPEQLESGRTGSSARSDVYSLGLVLFELLTLRHPRAGTTIGDWARSDSLENASSARAVDPSIPRDLDDVLRTALAPDPALRYSTMAAFADDLDACLRGERIRGGRRRWSLRSLRRALRRRSTWSLLLPFLLVATLLGVATSARLTRASLLEQVDARATGVAQLAAPEDLAAAGEWARGARERAGQLDEAPWSLVGPRATQPAAAALRRAIAERVELLVERDTRAALAMFSSTARARDVAEVQRRWRDAVLRCCEPGRIGKCAVRAESPVTVERRTPGLFGGGVEAGIDPMALGPGFYRATLDAPRRAVEFLVLEGQLVVPIETSTVHLSARLPTAPLTMADGGQGPEALEMTAADLTFGALSASFSTQELSSIAAYVPDADRSMDAGSPAAVNWITALEAASRLGARLPTPLELWTAHRDGLIVVPEGESHSYWCSMHDSGHSVEVALAVGGEPCARDELASRIVRHPRNAVVPDARMRLVTPPR